MIVDTSAILAVLKDEAEGEPILGALKAAGEPKRMSAASYLEAGIVLDSRGDPVLSNRLDDLMEALNIDIESVSPSQAVLARKAYQDYGKGSGHRARLNFGDCLSYALAKEAGERILFVGNDFAQTDLYAVPY